MRSPRSTSRAARSSPPIEGAGVIISSANDFRAAARRRIPRFLFDYADGGANAEETLRRNVGDLAGVALRQRVLKDVASIDLSATLFGRKQIGRAHVCTPVTNAQLVCRLLLEKKKT